MIFDQLYSHDREDEPFHEGGDHTNGVHPYYQSAPTPLISGGNIRSTRSSSSHKYASALGERTQPHSGGMHGMMNRSSSSAHSMLSAGTNGSCLLSGGESRSGGSDIIHRSSSSSSSSLNHGNQNYPTKTNPRSNPRST